MLVRAEIIESLDELSKYMQIGALPKVTLNAAIDQNPWFTPYFIRERMTHIATWLDRDVLHDWLQIYPATPSRLLNVGIIAAGNLPMVGFHDLLSTILSGQKVWIKPSRKDRILLEWLVHTWISIEPRLAKSIHIVDKIVPQQIDILIASGSNNTAQYLKAQYPTLPKILRKHRYSLAVLDSKITDQDIFKLKRDIFLYNGLGCRNVSNLLVKSDFNIEKLVHILNAEDTELLNSHYLHKVTLQRAKYLTLDIPFINGQCVLLKKQKEVAPTEMGF